MEERREGEEKVRRGVKEGGSEEERMRGRKGEEGMRRGREEERCRGGGEERWRVELRVGYEGSRVGGEEGRRRGAVTYSRFSRSTTASYPHRARYYFRKV